MHAMLFLLRLCMVVTIAFIYMAVWFLGESLAGSDSTIYVHDFSCRSKPLGHISRVIVMEGTIENRSTASIHNLQIYINLINESNGPTSTWQYGPTLITTPIRPGERRKFDGMEPITTETPTRCEVYFELFKQNAVVIGTGKTSVKFSK